MPNPNTKGISVHVDRELHAEITAYLQEHNMKMGDFIALAAQMALRPPSPEIDPELRSEIAAYVEEHDMTMDEFFRRAAKNELHPQVPGIDARLQAEINAYLEEHDMTMGEFISLAAQDEMHPKTTEMEVKEVGRMRTLAFQVNEELFQRVKQYLERNNMTQKQFVIGLIEEELERDEELLRKQREGTAQGEEESQDEAVSGGGEAPVSEDGPGDEYEDEQEETPAVGDSEGGFGEPDEEESEQDWSDDEPEYADNPDEDFDELEAGEYPGETAQDEAPFEGSVALVSEDDPGDEYEEEQEEAPDVGNSEGGFGEPDEEESEQDAAEALPDRGFIEGDLGAAIEVAPIPDFGEDDQPPFPEPDDEEDQEYGGMNMGM